MMNICDIGTSKLAYQFAGEGDVTFVIDAALGTCSAEWRHIARALEEYGRVLVYDRAGYGQSTMIRFGKKRPGILRVSLSCFLILKNRKEHRHVRSIRRAALCRSICP
jgi:pimeloyl-ACP methyl ester carboxylesterase